MLQMRKLLFVILSIIQFDIAYASTLVDSAYNLALRGDLQEAVRLNNEALSLIPQDSIGARMRISPFSFHFSP